MMTVRASGPIDMTTAASRARKLFSLGLSPEKVNEVLGVMIAAFVVLLAASLVSFHPHDPSVLHQPADADAPIRNWIGPVGAQVSAMLFAILGLATLVLPVVLGTLAWKRLTSAETGTTKERACGVAAVLVSLPGLCQLVQGSVVWRGIELDSGGVTGVLLSQYLTEKLNFGGAFLVLFTTLLVGSSLAAHTTLTDLLATARERLAAVWEHLMVTRVRRHKRREGDLVRRRVIERREPTARDRPAAAEDSASGAAAPAPPELELPNRVLPKKGEGHFAIRKVRPSAAGGPPPPPPPPPPPRRRRRNHARRRSTSVPRSFGPGRCRR